MQRNYNMLTRIVLLILGGTISALGIASIANSGLGLFGITAAYLGLSEVTGISFALVNAIVEGSILIYVCFKGEGVGLAAILSCTYVSFLIDKFMLILPHHWALVILGPLTMFGWSIMALSNMGEQASNVLTTVLVKRTGKSVTFSRTLIESVYYITAILTARKHLSILTLVLVLVTGKILDMFYKLFKYDPAKANHSYLIKLKNKEVK